MSLLYTLPHDVHVDILTLLPLTQLVSYMRCSKQCKQVAEDDKLWYGKGFVVQTDWSMVPQNRLCHSAVVSFLKNKFIVYLF